jgi:hypothetical protein
MYEKPFITAASFPPVRVSFYFDSDSDDGYFCEKLDHHLAPLERSGHIQMWDKRQIRAGEETELELQKHLSADHLLILLISADFLASEACQQQMHVALERHRKGSATVIPIPVRSCAWEQTELQMLQVLPRGQKAVPFRSLTDEVLSEIVAEIRKVIDCIQPWVFVTYAPEDRDFVDRLQQDLASSNVRLFLDQGQDTEIRETMHKTSTVLLVVSPKTASSSVVQEQMKAVAEYERPVLVLQAQGEDWLQPYPVYWQAGMVFDSRAEQYEVALAALVARLQQPMGNAATPGQTLSFRGEPRNPYKGLNAFDENDARDFFGREALIRTLAAEVEHILDEDSKANHPTRLLTVLLGASGSGKSSVVRAGLLPFLRHPGISNSQEWVYLEPIVPGTQPLERLATSFAKQPGMDRPSSLLRDLRSDSLRTFHELALDLVGSSTRKVVLFIDQFEEIFTLTASKEDQKHFLDLLVTAVSEPHGPLLVLLTLRADFYNRPMEYSNDLYQLLMAHCVPVLPLGRDDLRRVIEGPAQLPGVELTFEKDLVGDLLFDMRDQGVSLPLLQFTLDQLFKLRNGRQITRAAYDEIGGVKGALLKHAEKTYAELPSKEHRELAQTLFMRLVHLGENQQEATRRRAILSELTLLDPQLTQRLTETREAFIKARLIMTDTIADETTIEICHEALIREWPLCRTWIEEARKNRPFQQDLTDAADQWQRLGQPEERLYRGSQLKTVRKKVDIRSLNPQVEQFLRTSVVKQRWRWVKMVAAFLLPVVVLALVLTPILVYRPSWCPALLCPAAQVVRDTGGTYDTNLQVTFQTLQSSFHLLPGDPASYTLGDLPMANDVQLLTTSQMLPYHVVLKIHSLQQGRFGLVIDQLALVVNRQAQVIPYPLRVWMANNVSTFNNNLYRVTYRGQGVKATLTALYVAQPLGFVSLLPGETDELSLEVRSMVVVDLHFQVQVMYHVIGQLASHTLTLPNVFAIIFSDPANWHPYQLQDGHLVATP